MPISNADSFIPILIAFQEGNTFRHVHTSRFAFEKWRATKALIAPELDVWTDFGILNINFVPIIVTMNGFVYDKILEQYTGQLLRPKRMVFNWDINMHQKL